jgi:hypothetical protein
VKQLISNATNLLLSLPEGKEGIKPIPMAEIVLSVVEPVYRLVNNQMVREPILTDFRFTIDREGLQSLIDDLMTTKSNLAEIEDRFDGTQFKLPI